LHLGETGLLLELFIPRSLVILSDGFKRGLNVRFVSLGLLGDSLFQQRQLTFTTGTHEVI